ncbi:hypothetical protein T230_09510 [Tannerella sp. oral taxon BU063 isolate Cell 1/3]|uniref:Uncharacterized protein n=1 Tax=Tannerella sp. oral taxon BU063 isolate Cell 1/3 TaxID=1411022 RepID=W2CIN1_9BACT|nr:hypothetical protein T230_09510 [Tannerella sp. oral taxon BU063 isolate Cell 1/3]
MLASSIGLTSCGKHDDPKPTPNEVQQHFAFVHYVDKSAYVGTFSDLTPQATDNKKAFEFGFGCYLFAKDGCLTVCLRLLSVDVEQDLERTSHIGFG